MFALTEDGVRLYYEEVGTGNPIIFVHEFSGDTRSWEAQVRHFSRDHRCIAFNARGYPPSDVPQVDAAYSQDRAADDIAALCRFLDMESAHVVGISMGAFATLHFGLRHPQMARSLVLAGCGVGAEKGSRDSVKLEVEKVAQKLIEQGMNSIAKDMAMGYTRIQLLNKDPVGWRRFMQEFCEHSAMGSALTLKNCQALRPSLYDLEAALREAAVPTLIIVGDEDDPCLEPSLYLKRVMVSSLLSVVPGTGHAVNIEEPAIFNAQVREHVTSVDGGRWKPRDPRTLRSTAFPFAKAEDLQNE